MEPITLTAKQIKEMDELQLEKETLEKTLKVALCFYTNHLCEKEKERKKWWDEIMTIHKLDKSKMYIYNMGIVTLDEGKKGKS